MTSLFLPRGPRPLLVLFCAFLAARAFGATYVVDSVAALQAKINAAVPGDTITVKDGTYATTQPISTAAVGADGRLITIAAETIGGVEISGTAGFDVVKPAAFIVIQGFRFTHASGHEKIAAGTGHVRFTRNTFVCAGEGEYLHVAGDDAEVDHNEFRDKHTLGNMISVTGAGSQVARRLHIHHNYFHDFTNAHGNGAETLRFGLSGLSMSTGEGLVEYNLFVRCTGENELISNKSCGNTYRYNTFLDNPGAELSQRHGNDCLIYGNYLRHTQGIRIFGDRHLVFSNYLEGNSIAITIGNGDGEVADGAKLTSHDRPDGCVIAFNTLVDNAINYQMMGRSKGLGATKTTFANNLIQGGGKAAQIADAATYRDAIWSNNLVWQTAGPGDLPAGMFVSADPRLERDASDIFRPQPGSPALAAATGNFTKVTVDMDGQPRPAKKSIGADEPGTAPIIAHLLTPAEVGPMAKE